MTVDRVTTVGMTGTVTCSRKAQPSMDGSVVQHRDGPDASAYGHTAKPVVCGPSPGAGTIRFSYHSDLTVGPATYRMFASANDRLDNTFTELSGQISISGPADESTR